MNSDVKVVDLFEEDPSESVDSNNSDSHEEGGSDVSTTNNFTDRSDSNVELLHVQHEERQVRKAKYMLAIMTLFCAIAVSVVVYFSASQNEYHGFEEEVRLE